MQKYKYGDEVYVGDTKFRVDCYDETAVLNPKTLDMEIPGYDLIEVTTEYFSHPTTHTYPARMVHRLPLSERVLRIEEKMRLDDE